MAIESIRKVHRAEEQAEDLIVFHAGTSRKADRVVTAGGRVLGVTGLGENVSRAAARAYQGIEKISFEGMYCRRDIARREINRLQAPANRK